MSQHHKSIKKAFLLSFYKKQSMVGLASTVDTLVSQLEKQRKRIVKLENQIEKLKGEK